MALVTLAQVKRHLRLDPAVGDPLSDEEEDLTLKAAQAEALIFNYLELADGYWTEADVPPVVQAAVLVQVAEFWAFRGDDRAADAVRHVPGELSQFVVNLLRRYRNPVLV